MYGEGFVTDNFGYEQMVRVAWSSAFKGLAYTNSSDDSVILQNRNGTYYFDASGALTWCDLADSTMSEVSDRVRVKGARVRVWVNFRRTNVP